MFDKRKTMYQKEISSDLGSITPPTKPSSLESTPKKTRTKRRRKVSEIEINEQITSLFSYEFEDMEKYILCPSERIEELFSEAFFKIQSIAEGLFCQKEVIQNLLAINLNHYKSKLEKVRSVFLKNHSYNFENLPQLKSFQKHCLNCGEYALHKCNSPLYIIDQNYVICKKCLVVYRAEQIECYCNYDKTEYFTKQLSKEPEEGLTLSATWQTYHCGLINIDVMRCTSCGGVIYLDPRTGDIQCKNNNCRFRAKPNLWSWKCEVCLKDFKTGAILYNPVEKEMLDREIRRALLAKQDFQPKAKICECIFASFHLPDCKGKLYKGTFHDKNIVVCEKCKQSFYEDTFTLECDKCKGNSKSGEPFGRKTMGFSAAIALQNERYNNFNTNATHLRQICNLSLEASAKENPMQIYRLARHKQVPKKEISLISLVKNQGKNGDGSTKIVNKQIQRGRSFAKKGKSISPKKLSKDLDLNDYNILSEIGSGSYATVYLVYENNSGRRYALKKIIANDFEELAQFKNQIHLVTSISHLGILQILKYLVKKLDSTTYVVYLLLPLAECDWAKKVEEGYVYTQKMLLNILAQMTSTLSFLQQNKICHRDIKPQNIFIFDQGRRYLLADFDEAIKVKESEMLSKIKGTELFMAPKIYNAYKEGNPSVYHNVFKSDVYSFGLCLIFAMTNDYELLSKIQKQNDKQNYEMIHRFKYKTEYTIDFINLIMKMIKKDEKERCDFIYLSKILAKFKM